MPADAVVAVPPAVVVAVVDSGHSRFFAVEVEDPVEALVVVVVAAVVKIDDFALQHFERSGSFLRLLLGI